MSTPRILAFSGSLRRDSFNHKIVLIAAEAARAAGAEVTVIRLIDQNLPLYNEDVEREGIPAGVVAFKALLAAHNALLISSPEYNGGPSGALKNAIDWASRTAKGDTSVFAGKTAGLLAASPGPLGGIRALPMVRQILSGVGVLVIPEQAAVGSVAQHLAADGSLSDEKLRGMVQKVGQRLAAITSALNP